MKTIEINVLKLKVSILIKIWFEIGQIKGSNTLTGPLSIQQTILEKMGSFERNLTESTKLSLPSLSLWEISCWSVSKKDESTPANDINSDNFIPHFLD